MADSAPTHEQDTSHNEPIATSNTVQRHAERRNVIYPLPIWQPDAEAPTCTYCSTPFNLFNRRHHCRNCGKVVCGQCSPLRKYMPVEFIVRNEIELPDIRVESGNMAQVRVCNACSTLPIDRPPTTRDLDDTMHARLQSMPVARSVDNPILIRNDEEQYRPPAYTNTSLPRRPYHRDPSPPRVRPRSDAERSRSSRAVQNLSSPSTSAASTHIGQSLSPLVSRRRTPAEADTCPVCHLELPRSVSTSNLATDFREIHIRNCVENRFSAQPAQSPRATIVSNSPAAYVANRYIPPLAQPSSRPVAVPNENTPEGRMLAREQRHAAVVFNSASLSSPSSLPGQTTSMLPYIATEKDCLGEAECTICFEEFEIGDVMARLECLCKFHKKCIDAWWISRPNRCPVHGQDFYA